MPNMSYCRFRNTLTDLIDCEDALNETDGISRMEEGDEKEAAIGLLRLCQRIVDNYGDND